VHPVYLRYFLFITGYTPASVPANSKGFTGGRRWNSERIRTEFQLPEQGRAAGKQVAVFGCFRRSIAAQAANSASGSSLPFVGIATEIHCSAGSGDSHQIGSPPAVDRLRITVVVSPEEGGVTSARR